MLAGWDHIGIDDNSHNDSEAYFYSYYDPVNDETKKELTIYYFTYTTIDDEIYVTIEQDNNIIGNWDHKEVHLDGSKSYIPAKTAAERIILSSNSTSDIIVTIDNAEQEDLVMIVSYDYDDIPPFPIMLTGGDDSIYPEKNGVYNPNLTFGYQYIFNFNAPSSQGFVINEGDNFNINLVDTYGTTHNLVNEGYVQFLSSGALVTIPSQIKVFGTDTNEWGLTAPIDIIITPGWLCYNFWNSNGNFFEGLMSRNCNIQTMIFPVTSSGGGSSCPTLFVNENEVNNVLSLAENKSDDVVDYLLFDDNLGENGNFMLSIKEKEEYVNYIDQISVIPISHADNVNIGVTTQGNIFSYITDEVSSVDLRTDSTLILLSTDTLYVPIDEYNFPTNEVYLLMTSRLYDTRGTAGEKDATDVGEKVRSDSVYCFDVIGNHENLYTSYSQIPVTLVESGVGDVVIMPRNDIEIHELSFICTNMRSNALYNIEDCDIISASNENYSLENTFQKLLYPDEDYVIFGQNQSLDLKLKMDSNLHEKIDVLIRVKGRYISEELYEDIPSKVSFKSYPNPFNPISTISFSVNKPCHITLSVYNIKGQKVTTLVSENRVQNNGYGIRIVNSDVEGSGCILFSNEPEQYNLASGTLDISFSDIEGGYEGVGNISEDPLFLDAGSDNFLLQLSSPCINLGDPFLEPDPDGTRKDMGALYTENDQSSLYADFYSSEEIGEIPFTVQFYDNSRAFNTVIIDRVWQFSENDFSSMEDPSFTYTEPGFYDVSLIIEDELGNSSSMLKEEYVCATAPGYNGPIWYVSNEGSDIVGNGSVFYPFMTIQNAIEVASENDIIIIEPGTYQENLTVSSMNLILASRYFLTGDESYIDNTILDGNYNGSVLSFYGAIDSTCIVSGLKIINGYSGAGGGVYCENASPKLASLIIESCEVNNGGPYSRGGGIYCNDSELIIENSIVRNNTCQNATYLQGGGMYANNSNILVRKSVFSNNQSEYGGGIYLHNSESVIINTMIRENEADINAAGIGVNVSNAELINCVIAGNVAMEFGGAICGWDYADIILTNCTLTENTGVLNGGGMFLNNGVTGILNNSILWENIPEQIYYHPSNSPNQVEVNYSCFTNGESGITTSGNGVVTWLAGNIEDDPEFFDSGEHPFQLNGNSPCIDTGSTETANLNLPEFDILGNFRFWDGDEDENIVIDMGAYEYSAPQYQVLMVDPTTLEFYTYEECAEGLTFSVINNNSYELDIYDITQSGNFGECLAIWGITNFDIELPYEISPDEELEFNVEVGLPVEELRDILIDHIYITTEYGQQYLTLLLDGDLITSSNENDIPYNTQLLGNYPNPFNPETVISYQLAQDSYVEIEIFNIKGQCIRTLVEGEKQAGTNEVIWTGRNSQDQKVCSGIYFYRMEAGDYVEMKRMVLLK